MPKNELLRQSTETETFPKSKFVEKLEARQLAVDSVLCVGLDPYYERIPSSIRENNRIPRRRKIVEVMVPIIESTKDLVCAYKLDFDLYLSEGTLGVQEFTRIVEYLKRNYSDIPVIADVKAGGTEMANESCSKFFLDRLGADAITVNPYAGQTTIEPFIKREDKGFFVLCKTSNSDSGEFQNLSWRNGFKKPEPKKYLYEVIAERVKSKWNRNGNAGLVVGGTYPYELLQVRKIAQDLPILIPAIGEQNGYLEASVKSGTDSKGLEIVISASRSVVYASSSTDFAQAARREAEKLRDEINQYRNAA